MGGIGSQIYEVINTDTHKKEVRLERPICSTQAPDVKKAKIPVTAVP
jgi:hypothetical protein